MIQRYIFLLENTTSYIIHVVSYTWGMCWLDVKGIYGMFQVSSDGQNESFQYILSFHAHVLVYEASVQKLLRLRLSSR